ncbi:NlpC/P60 family protein [Kytococcus sedentarius]|uniref:NlpC/P60 family protein n=1 Tax=Kytococcus sedentarius TaxID=1276 RepID=UPI0035BC87BE
MTTVSVIIPVLDDADALHVCLGHLLRQRVLPDEVVVVDNGPEPTAGLVRRSDLPFALRVVHEPRRGTASASARGFDAAHGDLLARCDADCRPDDVWVQALVEAFDDDPGLDAVTGTIAFHDLPGWRGVLGTLFYRVGMGVGMHLALARPALWGSNLALRATAWRQARDAVHRDDPLVHDDLDLSFVLGPLARVRRVPGMRVTAEARIFDSPRHLATRVRRALHTCRLGWRRQPPGHRWVNRLTGGRYLWAKEPREELRAGDTAFVDVAVATLWVEPGTDRSLDAPAVGAPVDPVAWNRVLDDAAREWMVGRVETQALLGTRVTVTERRGDWAHVVVHDQPTPRDPRGYPGWVPVAQVRTNPTFARQLTERALAVVTADSATLCATPSGGRPRLAAGVTTTLPVLSAGPGAVQLALPDGSAAWADAGDVARVPAGGPGDAPSGEELVATAERFLGLRYLWAGVSPWGLDCSGFALLVHRIHGIDIPRDADAQAEAGEPVAEQDLRPGDLLFFAEPGGVGFVHHVGIHHGDGRMIHAPNPRESVCVVDWRAWDAGREFSGARRYLSPRSAGGPAPG